MADSIWEIVDGAGPGMSPGKCTPFSPNPEGMDAAGAQLAKQHVVNLGPADAALKKKGYPRPRMSAQRACAESGLLVDGDTRLLTDPCEYFHPAAGVQVGCGRLRCESCKAWVRGGPPGLAFKDDTKKDLRALHRASDWSALPFLERTRSPGR